MHELYRGAQLVDTLEWTGPTFVFPLMLETCEVSEQRAALREKAIARAYELRALSFTRRNPNWLESDHYSFLCSESSETEVAVTTPVGVFYLAARRVRKGQTTTSGTFAHADQDSPPVQLFGRLLSPSRWTKCWLFQPGHFVYADGTRSDFLGSYPRDIRWEQTPDWNGIVPGA